MFRSQYRSLPAYALLACVSLLLLAGRARHVHTQSARSFGCLTAQQVLLKSRPICQAIAPYSQTFYLSADPSDGSRACCWSVQCEDASGRDLADLTWNAVTGELYLASGNPPWKTMGAQALLNAQEAKTCAYSYLETLGVTTQPKSWHIILPPDHTQNSISTEWAGEGKHAIIQIEAHSGYLLKAEIWRPSVPGATLRQPTSRNSR